MKDRAKSRSTLVHLLYILAWFEKPDLLEQMDMGDFKDKILMRMCLLLYRKTNPKFMGI